MKVHFLVIPFQAFAFSRTCYVLKANYRLVIEIRFFEFFDETYEGRIKPNAI